MLDNNSDSLMVVVISKGVISGGVLLALPAAKSTGYHGPAAGALVGIYVMALFFQRSLINGVACSKKLYSHYSGG